MAEPEFRGHFKVVVLPHAHHLMDREDDLISTKLSEAR